MKKLSTLFIAMILSFSTVFAQTFVNEDFNSGIPGSWTVVDGGTTTDTWFGTTGGDGGNYLDGTEFAFVDSDGAGSGPTLTEELQSPSFDASSATSVFLEFDQYYNWIGSDTAYIDVFDGTGWVNVVKFNADMGGWSSPDHQTIDISTYANANMQVRFRYEDNGVWAWYWAVDNVSIYAPVNNDLGVIAASAPVSGCGLSSAEQVTIDIHNNGLVAQSNFNVGYSLNGTPITPETVASTINPGDTLTYTFSTTADLSTPAVHSIDAYTLLATDQDSVNDTLSYTAEHYTPITAPYTENFDGLSDGDVGMLSNGWTSLPSASVDYNWEAGSGTTGSFATGPSGDHTTGSDKYMYTEASDGGSGDVAELISPCIDLGSLPNPQLGFWFHRYGADIDTTHVDIYAGGTWNNDVDTVVMQPQTDETDPWVNRTVDLSSYAGQVIRIRFRANSMGCCSGDMAIDDVNIYGIYSDDLEVINISSPNDGCGLSANEQVTIDIHNKGLNAQSGYNVGYSLNGTPITPETVASTINPGDTVTYTFSAAADLSTPAVHTIDAYTLLSGDGNTANDTLSKNVEHFVPITTPYKESFDSLSDGDIGNYSNGWVSSPTSGFAWEADQGGTTSGSTGPSGDHTSGSGIYMYTEASSGSSGDVTTLTSPCIDLSPLNSPYLTFWYHKYGTDMGDLYIDIESNGIWMNDVDSIIGETHNSDGEPWLQKTIDLSAFAGATIRVRFRGERGGGYTGDMAIDDINIDNIYNYDASFVTVLEPSDNTCADSMQTVKVVMKNNGFNTISNVPVYIQMSGAISGSFTGTVGGPMAFNETDTAVVGTINTYPGGAVTFTGSSTLLLDQDLSNDTSSTTVDISVVPDAPVAMNDTVCAGDSAMLTVAAQADYSFAWYDSMTGGTMLAMNDTFYTSVLTGDSTYYVEARNYGEASVVITEVNTNNPDAIEIQNVSGDSVDVTGWTLALSDSYTNINTVNSTEQTLSGYMQSGELDYWTDGSTNAWGTNIFWSSGSNGWAILLDDQGNVVDYVAWGWSTADIQTFNATIGGSAVSLTPSDWTGVLNATCSSSLIRQGSTDNNDSSDFVCGTTSFDTTNAGLMMPMVNTGIACFGPRTPVTAHVIPSTPNPNFSATMTGNNQGREYQFTAVDSGATTDYFWDFNDSSNTSTQKNPTYTFTGDGTYIVCLTVSNVCGSDTSCTTIQVVGVEENGVLTAGVVVYPNPSDGVFNFEALLNKVDQLNLTVTTTTGAVVYSKDINKRSGEVIERIDLSDQSKGVYFLKVTADDRTAVEKLIID